MLLKLEKTTSVCLIETYIIEVGYGSHGMLGLWKSQNLHIKSHDVTDHWWSTGWTLETNDAWYQWCIHEELEEQAKLLNNMVHKTHTYTYIYVKLCGDVCSGAWIHYRSTCLPWRFGATICLSARKTKGVIRWCPRRTTSGELIDCCLGHTGPYKLQICLQSRSNTRSEWTEQRLLEPSWQESRKAGRGKHKLKIEILEGIPIFSNWSGTEWSILLALINVIMLTPLLCP